MSLSKQVNLSFAGCGFLGIYHVGVAACFKEYAPNVLVNKISGASAGALAACSLLCGVSMNQVTSDILKVATIARQQWFGAFNPMFNITKIIRDRLNEALPSDAHQICTGRLHVSVTRLPRGKNVLLSDFRTRDELIQAIVCSTFIPVFSGYLPEKYRGERYIDGGYSNNLPILDENTVTVSPFCGESDICPQDNSYNLFQVNFNNTSIELSPQNLIRIKQILFPPEVEILSDMCKQGFQDALRFLQRNNMVTCVQCIQVKSELQLQDTTRQSSDSDESCSESEVEDREDYDYEEDDENLVCEDCSQRRLKASVDDFPETVLSALEDAALSMNSGLINWVFKHKSMRVLSVLTLPYILPFDIARAAYSKFMEIVPKFSNDLAVLMQWLMKYVQHFIENFTQERHLYGAKFSCQLAITEYDFANEETIPIRKRSRSMVSRSDGRRGSMPVRPLSGDWGPCPHRSRRGATSPGSRRMSCVNFGISVDLAGQVCPKSRPLKKALDSNKMETTVVDFANQTILNWDSSFMNRPCEEAADHEFVDTFEQVLQVTRQQESILAYYYLDEVNKKIKVTEIFASNKEETGGILPPDELQANRNLEWDEAFTDLNRKSDSEFYGVAEEDFCQDEYEEGDPLLFHDPILSRSYSYLSLVSRDVLNDEEEEEEDIEHYRFDENDGEHVEHYQLDEQC